jgi:hypothetical protein
MQRKIPDWEHLDTTADIEHLMMISGKELKASSLSFVQSVRHSTLQEIHSLSIQGKCNANLFYQTQLAAREEGGPDEQSYLGTRARVKGGSLCLEWYRNRFRIVQTPRGAKKKVFSQYIPKNRADGYTSATFSKEPQWARDVAAEVEGEYQKLRKRGEILGKIKRLLGEYEKLVENNHYDDDR